MDYNYINIKNPDETHRKIMIRAITANGGYCASKREKNEDTKCKCKVYRETGVCSCGLFLKIPAWEVPV